MAHAHDLGDGRHREAVAVGLPDGSIPFGAQLVGGPIQLLLALGVLLDEGCEAGFGLWGLAFGAGDPWIVVAISASRLA